jgi:hypothetical protein
MEAWTITAGCARLGGPPFYSSTRPCSARRAGGGRAVDRHTGRGRGERRRCGDDGRRRARRSARSGRRRGAPRHPDGGEARRGIRIVIRHDDGSRSRLRAGLDSGALGDSSAAWSGFPYRSGRDATNFDMGYSRSEFFVDLCVNVLVRPTRISPRQSGAAGPCSTTQGCTARPDRRLRTAVSSADRAESLGL